MKKISQFLVATGEFYPPPVRFPDHQFDEGIKQAVIPYNFATHGGAIGARSLPGIMPAGAIILGGFYETLTTFTSATDAATVALAIEAANDLKSAIAISNGANPWDAGRTAIIPVWTAATSVKTTVERQVSLTVAVEALTAGKLNLHLFYTLSRTFKF